MQMAKNPPMEHMPPHQSWGPPPGLPPNAGGGPGFGHNSQYMPPPRQLDSYYPPPELPPPVEPQSHQGISAYGRDVPVGMHAPSNAQSAPSMIKQVIPVFPLPFFFILLLHFVMILVIVKFRLGLDTWAGSLTQSCLPNCGRLILS